MKVNFNIPFRDFLGKEVAVSDHLPTIGKSLGFNLFNIPDKVVSLSAEQKFTAYTLAVKLANAEAEAEITPQEAEVIDMVASKVYFPGYYGQVKQLLNP